MAEDKSKIILKRVKYIYYIALLLVGTAGLYELIVLARSKKTKTGT